MRIFLLALLMGLTTQAIADEVGHFQVPSTDIGTTVNLTGQWRFTPAGANKEVDVPVPQMLSRIQWWLDDSEDFKKWEQARLNALGFDTDKTDEGAYRITFDVPKDWPKGRHLWVEFDGVAMKCKTSCNGQELGEHKGMFSRFGYDLTEHLKPGEKNELTVWVSMEKIPQTDAKLGEAVTVNLSAAKVISMSKGMFGPLTPNKDNRAYDLMGIWQPVRLVVRGGAKINDVFFQPNDSLDGARVDIEVQSSGYMGKTKVRARWLDPDPKVLERWELSQSADLAGIAHVQLQGSGISPRLWSPANPNIYKLQVTLETPDGKILDRWTHNVGFRTFKIQGNQFLLNGKPYFLRGANQLPYGKNPWNNDLPRKLIQFMHDGNLRFTRTHATPWNENWLNAADEIGVAVSIEGIRPWAFAGKAADPRQTVMPPKEIYEHWLMENEDVVKRCRNHPSVFIFTIGNEMLLRDAKNMEKWKLLSGVVKQTRGLAPHHPLICSSDYTRDPEFYESTLKPAGIDDGDIDDMHRYNGWYADSVFLVGAAYEREAKASKGARPLIGQEMATGYPDLDTGLPVMRYTRDLVTPQAWVGVYAYPSNDPAIWLTEHARVTKRWAEQMRYQRGSNTAGFSLFSLECWFQHSYLPEAQPYPVYEAVKQAFAPIGVALETNQRRFWGGDQMKTNVFVTNDDEAARDLTELSVICEFNGVHSEPAPIQTLKYYTTAKVPVVLQFSPVDQRTNGQLVTRVMQGDKEVSRTVDTIDLFPKPTSGLSAPESVLVVKRGASVADLAPGRPLRQKIESGATCIVFAPPKNIVQLFPNDLLDIKNDPEKDLAEFADWYPARGTKLAANLQPMDLKWWARKGDDPAFIATSSHRLKQGGRARELIRFIPSHSYIPAEKVPDQYRTVLSEIPLGKGRLWICDLGIDASASVDPAARLFADNLYTAAADPDSTKTLQPVPSHEELLRGMKP
ncbi:MAG TPA: glycoside hydrolase family 2 TIM barrel-domain containing protein [Tepidisphaeraceae bacterium]|jgi:hypothetical protein